MMRQISTADKEVGYFLECACICVTESSYVGPNLLPSCFHRWHSPLPAQPACVMECVGVPTSYPSETLECSVTARPRNAA